MPARAAKETQQCRAARWAERGIQRGRCAARREGRPFPDLPCGRRSVRLRGSASSGPRPGGPGSPARRTRGSVERASGPAGGAFVRGRSGAPPLPPPATPPRQPGRTQPPGPGDRVSTPPARARSGEAAPPGPPPSPSAGHAFFRLPEPGPGPGLPEVTWGAAGRALAAGGRGTVPLVAWPAKEEEEEEKAAASRGPRAR